MQKTRKIPQRQCVGCREMKDKKALLRIVKTPEGEILLDSTGKKSGRGAYVCPDPECLKKARKSRALERAFDTAIPAEVYDALEGQMVALVTGLKAGDFVHTLGDAHIYTNHLEQVKLQLTRDPRPLPRMEINPDVKDIFGFQYEDFNLTGYDPHPHIKGEVAV